ncbi:MAG: ComF family protein [Cryobacterium sp.]|uniref:ComF family protein n=1 Tax=unclassified Cryobacterium TaxID=2649013 RepID=UPI0018CA6246|nr:MULTISPECIES: phosphoribosyltransferase family protein [unclassified Cryobacterium]MCY7404935.1 ComF family protein [Cryobacterium sp.]MEC5153227.1 putative amidophosphoribosyltransferase [Cryobacterium sp. CAN_C3]
MSRWLRDRLAGAGRDAWATLLPTECSGCGAVDRALCAACRRALVPGVHPVTRDDAVIWSALTYAGVARQVIAAYKDGGRTDAGAVLAAPLRTAIVAALAAAPRSSGASNGIQLVTIPSSGRAWRARGYHPVDALLHRAGLHPYPALSLRGEVLDQVGLGRTARATNKKNSLVARRPLEGTRMILVDDIVTTGATLLEARRAVFAAGGTVVGLATLAETQRLRPQ